MTMREEVDKATKSWLAGEKAYEKMIEDPKSYSKVTDGAYKLLLKVSKERISRKDLENANRTKTKLVDMGLAADRHKDVLRAYELYTLAALLDSELKKSGPAKTVKFGKRKLRARPMTFDAVKERAEYYKKTLGAKF